MAEIRIPKTLKFSLGVPQSPLELFRLPGSDFEAARPDVEAAGADLRPKMAQKSLFCGPALPYIGVTTVRLGFEGMGDGVSEERSPPFQACPLYSRRILAEDDRISSKNGVSGPG